MRNNSKYCVTTVQQMHNEQITTGYLVVRRLLVSRWLVDSLCDCDIHNVKLRQHTKCNDIYRQVSEWKTTRRKLGRIANHNIIIGSEPDQSTPTPSSDHADSDNTAATAHNTGKRTKKGEMEDVYVEGYRERPIDIISGSWPCLPCASWIGVQLAMNAGGLRNLFTCPTWWFV